MGDPVSNMVKVEVSFRKLIKNFFLEQAKKDFAKSSGELTQLLLNVSTKEDLDRVCEKVSQEYNVPMTDILRIIRAPVSAAPVVAAPVVAAPPAPSIEAPSDEVIVPEAIPKPQRSPSQRKRKRKREETVRDTEIERLKPTSPGTRGAASLLVGFGKQKPPRCPYRKCPCGAHVPARAFRCRDCGASK